MGVNDANFRNPVREISMIRDNNHIRNVMVEQRAQNRIRAASLIAPRSDSDHIVLLSGKIEDTNCGNSYDGN
jgi:hypothetical protein